MDKIFDRLGGIKPVVKPTTVVAPPPERKKPGPKPGSKNKPRVEEVKPRSKPGPKPGSKNRPKAAESSKPVTPPALPKKTYEYPHLNAQFYTTPEGQVMISVDFNKLFVANLDEKYRNDPSGNLVHEDNVKVALFLYGVLSEMVEPYLDEAEVVQPGEIPPEADIMRDIPPMMVRGGPDQTQRVDISQATRVAVVG